MRLLFVHCEIGYHGSPVFDVCTTRECMTDDHAVVSVLVQLAPRFVRDWDIVQHPSRLERESGQVNDCLTLHDAR
jgi:hypothetical protein